MSATALVQAPRKSARTQRKAPSRAAAKPATAPKSGTLSIRVDEETRHLIDRAASVTGQNRSDFMLSSARERALAILLNQRIFGLSEANWDRFMADLDNPPPPNAKLKALLARVPIWDRQ